MTAASIRYAGPDDVPRLAELGVRTFVETFGHLYPPADLEAYLADAYPEDRFRAELEDPGKATLLGLVDGVAVGYAQVGPCALPHPDVGPDSGELKRLYLLREAQGHGLGTGLLHAALAWLERDGPRDLWLSVFEDNHGAQRLYRRHGFEEVGEWGFVIGTVVDRDLIYRRRPGVRGPGSR